MEFPDKDLDKIETDRHEFIRKHGAHSIMTDLDWVIGQLRQYRKREREYGFMSADYRQAMASFRHMCLRDHNHDPNHCAQCRLASETVKAIRGGEI